MKNIIPPKKKVRHRFYFPIPVILVLGALTFLTGCEKDLFTPAGTVTDVEGNSYKVIKIDTQIWFGENLKTTKYKNGISIPNVTDGFQWTDLTTGAYSSYDNSQSNINIYGNLYNWYAVNTGNLCPTGWHIPSSAEWKKLEDFLGGSYDAGGRLKEMGTTHWDEPNYGGINSFSTWVYGGDLSQYMSINYYAGFWSSTAVDIQTAIQRQLTSEDHVLGSWDEPKYSGLSVRCLKDN
jgi:uncharacterized protein (TIGR02145 family)